MKDATQLSTKILSSTIRSLVDSIDKTWTVALPLLDNLEDVGYLVWALSLSIALTTFFITGILMGGLSYGCCEVEDRADTTFITGAIFISIGSIALAMVSIIAMLLGGHAEVFLCRSFYDSPNFVVLEKLLDRPGLLLVNTSGTGLIRDLLRPPGVHSNHTSVNATLTNTILKCEQNGPSYQVFQLEGLMNISRVVDIYEYPELMDSIDVI